MVDVVLGWTKRASILRTRLDMVLHLVCHKTLSGRINHRVHHLRVCKVQNRPSALRQLAHPAPCSNPLADVNCRISNMGV